MSLVELSRTVGGVMAWLPRSELCSVLTETAAMETAAQTVKAAPALMMLPQQWRTTLTLQHVHHTTVGGINTFTVLLRTHTHTHTHVKRYMMNTKGL